MSGTAPGPVKPREDLGGGFVRVSDGARDAIEVGALSQCGYVGRMSTSSVNARDRVEMREWAEREIPGSNARLRGVDQVHSTRVVDAVQLRDGRRLEADGVWMGSSDDIPVVMAADCAPVWLAEPGSRVIALVHAGWRGVADGIIGSGLQCVAARGGRADQVVAAIGPHLRPCCFEVGPDVAAKFLGHTKPGSTLLVNRKRTDSVALDLGAAIAAQLRDAGVRTIGIAESCTRCRADLLHSYRRNGKGGPLMAALAVMPDAKRR